MQLTNTSLRYGLVAILFHWLMAVMMIALVVIGLWMTRMPISLLKLKLFGWHKEYGMLILFLVMLRIVWRIGNIVPLLPSTLPRWQKCAAHLVHWLFYILMIALPITGWLLTSASGLPVSLFGFVVLPDLVSSNESLRLLLIMIHQWLSYLLIFIFFAHVGAALKHHFINKDDILRRIL